MSSAETDTTTEAEASVEETPPTDDLRDGIVGDLRARLGDAVVDSHVAPGVDAWVRIEASQWGRTAEVLHDLGFTFFDYLSAIDWSINPHGKNEEPPSTPIVVPEDAKDLEHGITGGETRFQIIARVYSPQRKVGVHLKCDVPDDALSVPTWSKTYLGANWHERETHEMFGIGFDGHGDLRNLYLPGAFEGFPLRKDFPLLARHVKPWPGLVDVEPMPGEPEEDEGESTEAEG